MTQTRIPAALTLHSRPGRRLPSLPMSPLPTVVVAMTRDRSRSSSRVWRLGHALATSWRCSACSARRCSDDRGRRFGRLGSSGPPCPLVADPAALVHPLDGSGTGPVNPGTVGEYPGADLPFGMIQWSPDTTPNAVQSGGGYDDADSRINGFSLTHLSGTGCPSYQDVPILPTTGPVGTRAARDDGRHLLATPASRPPRAATRSTLPSPAPVAVSLAVTERSGIAAFTFPSGQEANVLFKVADSANPVSAASVEVVGHHEIEGQVTSGQFCGTGTNYTLHFVALFDHPFSAAGTWTATPAPRPGRPPALAQPAARTSPSTRRPPRAPCS